MFIRDFNQNGQSKIDKINKLLKEEFGMNIKSSYPEKAKIEKLLEMSNQAIVKLKDSSKNFQIQPEYAKYLGIRDIMETVLNELQRDFLSFLGGLRSCFWCFLGFENKLEN